MSIENGTCTINTPELEEWRDSAGKLHRLDGPARRVEHTYKYGDCNKKRTKIDYYLHGLRHRLDGPAFHEKTVNRGADRYNYEIFSWWVNGKLHRLDGPAFLTSKSSDYYINGIKLETMESYEKFRDFLIEHDKLLEIKNMISVTLETIKNSHEDTGENDEYYNVPKALVETLLEKIEN